MCGDQMYLPIRDSRGWAGKQKPMEPVQAGSVFGSSLTLSVGPPGWVRKGQPAALAEKAFFKALPIN